jgi:hypothetical protein
MKHTRDFKKKGFKGNSRGNHIQAPFATLEDLFKKLPKSIGFNIEMSRHTPCGKTKSNLLNECHQNTPCFMKVRKRKWIPMQWNSTPL